MKKAVKTSGQLTNVALAGPVSNELNLWEQEYDFHNRRLYQLRMIHSRQYDTSSARKDLVSAA